eukprot:54248-Pelagomonas_calceolata.AAC.4
MSSTPARTLQGVSSDSPEESTPAAIQAFEASHKALCTSLRETRRDLEVTKESNQRLVQEEATAQDQKAKAESKAKRQGVCCLYNPICLCAGAAAGIVKLFSFCWSLPRGRNLGCWRLVVFDREEAAVLPLTTPCGCEGSSA